MNSADDYDLFADLGGLGAGSSMVEGGGVSSDREGAFGSDGLGMDDHGGGRGGGEMEDVDVGLGGLLARHGKESQGRDGGAGTVELGGVHGRMMLGGHAGETDLHVESTASQRANQGRQEEARLLDKFRVLPEVRAVLEKIRDAADPQDVRLAMFALHQRFRQCEAELDALPGASMTKAKQMQMLGDLLNKLQRRR
mmetsp:Transcript_4772/g.9649  ORF Transcript_4772/g.9649 Transcript_4772/m.9649 type:complete len:196 (-) Transcript_4772:292-879(-)